jgi:hypothetical protein
VAYFKVLSRFQGLSKAMKKALGTSVYTIGMCLVSWLVSDHLLLRDFVIYGIIFMNVSVYCFRFSRHSGRAIY